MRSITTVYGEGARLESVGKTTAGGHWFAPILSSRRQHKEPDVCNMLKSRRCERMAREGNSPSAFGVARSR